MGTPGVAAGISEGVLGFAPGWVLGFMVGVPLVGGADGITFVVGPVDVAAPAAPELPVLLIGVVGAGAVGVGDSGGDLPSSDSPHAAAQARIMEAQIFAVSFMCSSAVERLANPRVTRGNQSMDRDEKSRDLAQCDASDQSNVPAGTSKFYF